MSGKGRGRNWQRKRQAPSSSHHQSPNRRRSSSPPPHKKSHHDRSSSRPRPNKPCLVPYPPLGRVGKGEWGLKLAQKRQQRKHIQNWLQFVNTDPPQLQPQLPWMEGFPNIQEFRSTAWRTVRSSWWDDFKDTIKVHLHHFLEETEEVIKGIKEESTRKGTPYPSSSEDESDSTPISNKNVADMRREIRELKMQLSSSDRD